MNIAITATEPSLDARVDPRFGRCPCFLIVDTDGMKYEAVENPNVTLGGGAGIQSAQLMSQKGVQFVLTGNCGPNAYQTLSAAGIGVIVGCGGSVADAIEQFKAGQLSTTGAANVASKSGIGAAPSQAPDRPAGLQQPPMTGGGMGMGRGGGRGGGRGQGRGMGRGGGMGQGQGGAGMGMGPGMGGGGGRGAAMTGAGAGFPAAAPPVQPSQGLSKEDELAMLRDQAEAMTQQMQQIQERVMQLAGKGGTAIAKVDAEKCTGCGLCIEQCPVHAISLGDEGAAVVAQTCTGCGDCVDTCPNYAISMA